MTEEADAAIRAQAARSLGALRGVDALYFARDLMGIPVLYVLTREIVHPTVDRHELLDRELALMDTFGQLRVEVRAHRGRPYDDVMPPEWRVELPTSAEVQEAIRAFVRDILHGDEEHQAWLLAAAESFIAGRPLPMAPLPPEGRS